MTTAKQYGPVHDEDEDEDEGGIYGPVIMVAVDELYEVSSASVVVENAAKALGPKLASAGETAAPSEPSYGQ